MALTERASERQRSFLGFSTTDLSMMLVVLIWGGNFSVVKLALDEIPPLAFAALRFAVACPLLLLLTRWLDGPLRFSPSMWWKLIWIGVVGNTIYQICFTLGLDITSAANASLLIATTPALVALTGAVLGIEQVTRRMIAGIFMAIAGVALVLVARELGFSLASLSGDLLMLGCVVSWTAYTLGVRTLGGNLSALRITTMTMVTGLPGLLIAALPELRSTDWAAVSIGAWFGLAYAALLALIVAYFLWNNSVRLVGSNRTAIYGCVIPLVAALIAVPTLGETFSWQQAIGAACIVSGVLLTRK